MARRDLTPISGFDLPMQGGAAASGADDLDAALSGSLARLRQVALRITRNAAAADDVVQSAALKALRHRRRFRGEAKASTWLHRIVVNEALMWYRSERRRSAQRERLAEHAASLTAPPAPQPLDVLLAAERRAGLIEALGTLRREDADLLAHCAHEGDYEGWARGAGLAASAAKTRAFRARRALRAVLGAREA